VRSGTGDCSSATPAKRRKWSVMFPSRPSRRPVVSFQSRGMVSVREKGLNGFGV